MRPRFYGEPSATMLYLGRAAFLISGFMVFFTAAYSTYEQYRIWEASAFSQLLLPPYQEIGYFIQYAITHFWTAPLIAAAAALLGLVSAIILNRKFQHRFFWPAEPWLFATALLLTGHPGWLYYVVALCLVFFLYSIFCILYSRTHNRASFYYLWIPVALLVILYSSVLTSRF